MKSCRLRLRRGRGRAHPRRGGKHEHHHGTVTPFIAALCLVFVVHVGHGLLSKCFTAGVVADESDDGRSAPLLNRTVINHSMVYVYNASSRKGNVDFTA